MTPEAELAAAIEHHRNRRFDAAEAAYASVLAAEPENVQALGVSAILLFQRGNVPEAIARLERALKIAPEEAGLHNNLANIYRETDEREKALQHYVMAVRADPGHIDSICNVGLLYRQAGKTEAALASFLQALELDPGHVESNHNLAMTYVELGMVEEAANHVERCYDYGRVPVVDPLWHVHVLQHFGRHERALEIAEMHARDRPDDPIAQHQLAALRGDAVARAPDDYVRQHFDQFAGSFDGMLENLDYRAPQLVAEQVGILCGGNSVDTLVDLGCGTGLVGPLVRRHARSLIGVDLSPGMLARAAERKINGKPLYDRLVEAELTAFLTAIPEGSIDLGISADTLCYFGALEEVLAAAHRAMRPGGAFIATLEHREDDSGTGHKLLDSGRYGHAEAYATGAATGAGFVLRGLHHVNLRREFGGYIRGLMLILENGPG